MIIEMYFAVNFSQLNYTYTISLAVHLRIINVDVPMSIFGSTPLFALPPTASRAGKPAGPAGPAALTPRGAAVGRRSGEAKAGWGSGKTCRLPAQFGPPGNRKRTALPGPARAASREFKRNRLRETGRFHLGLEFGFQVHVGAGGVGVGMSGNGVKKLVIHLDSPSALTCGPALTSRAMHRGICTQKLHVCDGVKLKILKRGGGRERGRERKREERCK